jgi:tripartite-type tricarboxylate transporter receptor subunit TctC
MKFLKILAIAALALGTAGASISRADDFPTKPIRLVVGFPPGGGTDVFVRFLAPYIATELGQQVVVENRTGANGNLATEFVARAAPDGYTLMISTSSVMGTGPHAYPTAPVHPVRDLAHVTLLAESPYYLVTNPGLPFKTYPEFVAAARREPGKYVFAAQGVGSAGHIVAELLQIQSGIDIKIVQYRGGGPVVTDLLANQVHLSIFSAQMSESYFRDGRIGAFFVMDKKRSPGLANMPASIELGIRSVDQITYWAGLHAPKGTPAAVVNRLHQAVVAAYKDKALQERMAGAGLTAIASPPAEFVARIESDLAMYGEIFRAANIKVE